MTLFKYSLVSDLHLDHPQPKTPYDKLEENVIVAGDCANGLVGLKFLRKLRNKGFKVFATDGNHEHYGNINEGRNFRETAERFREDHPWRVDVDDTLSVIMTNGWYKVSEPWRWFNYMNDGRYCFGTDPLAAARDVNFLALEEAERLRSALDEDRKFIIVTHTAPCTETLHPAYEGHFSNEWYWNPNLREIITTYGAKILAWNHGHTHRANSDTVDGVPVFCNPRGYPGENPNWAPLTLTVEY